MADWPERIASALGKGHAPSSDFDLNKGLGVPKNRPLWPAAVLIAVRTDLAVPTIILTKRSDALKHHPGQIAFPGGKQDAGDPSLEAAALREAEEEVGLDPGQVTLIGRLPPHETVTGFQVTPCVGCVTGPFRAVAETGEVDEVFEVPLDHVLDPARYQVQSRLWQGLPRQYYAVPYGPYYIWGATARMLRAWADLMT